MTYKDALSAYLSKPGSTESALAEAIGCKQPTINRYRKGERFPDAQTARMIDERTGGEVPFAIWQSEFLARAGLAA